MKIIDYIKELRYNGNIITREQEKALIKYFGENISKEYTKQDVWEQTRKVLNNN